MGKSIIITGSSRSKGHTQLIVDYILQNTDNVEAVDLNQFQISYFDYEHKNQNDDFIPLAERLMEFDTIIFATPVYWYTMSAIMKTFFDRLTDLMKIRKDLGRGLRGKNMMLVSCGSEEELIDSFADPFSHSAEYLDMKYIAHVHTWADNQELIPEVKKRLDQFIGLIP